MDKKEIFITKAKKRHGDVYDYSKIKYVDGNTKVKIICSIHGEFEQTPIAHARGNGCPSCANLRRGRFKRMTKEEFIEKAHKIHTDKYDYSKVKYVDSITKVCIICPIHGEFWMMPVNHIYQQKQGCPKCANRGLKTEEIIEMFRKVHGDKYNYSKVEYVKMHNKVHIICPTHGEFEQTPSKHLLGQGCPKCGIVERAKKKTKTTEQFIKEAKLIHGNKYDYSKTVYTHAFNKVKIICPTHGEFEQRAFDHIHNHGCQMCSESSLEREIKTLLKENGIEFERQKRFSWLDKQSLDFYLPEYNVAIECQGEQHFIATTFGTKRKTKEECLNEIQKRDALKLGKCMLHGVKVLYYADYEYEFPYKVYTDKKILLKEIKGET